jgi:hypothetical protein
LVQRIAGSASCSGNGWPSQCSEHLRSLDQQLWEAGPCSTSQRCEGWPTLRSYRSLHTSSSRRAQAARAAKEKQEDSEELEPKPRVGCSYMQNGSQLQPGLSHYMGAIPMLTAENILCVSQYKASTSKDNRHATPHLLSRHHPPGAQRCTA